MKRTGSCLYALIILGCALGMVASCGTGEEQGKRADTPGAVPAITSVEIVPDKPSKSTPLEAVAKPDQPDTVDLSYRWMKNGKEIMGETESTLEADNFQKGDTIAVEATPSLNKVKGEPRQSDTVVIANSLPVLKSFVIEPSPARSRDELTARLDVFDADGEYIRSSYQWKKGNLEIQGATESTLPPSYFKRGDKISCRARVSDGESPEVSYYTSEIEIYNSAPLITSRPTPDRMEGSSYEYAVTAEDADEDPIEFSLDSPPEGMTIDSATGLIRWQVSEGQKEGSFEFKVIARDAKGAEAVQPVTVKLSPGGD